MASEKAISIVDVSESETVANIDNKSGKRRATKEVGERIIALKRTRSGHIAYLTLQYKAIETALLSYENKESVDKYAVDIADQWKKFCGAHHECMLIIDDAVEKEELEQSFHRQETGFNELNSRLEEWHVNRNAALKPRATDDVSVTSSQLRDATLKRGMAELKLKQLNQRQAIEQQKRLLEQQLERQDVQAEIDQAELEESILNESIDGDSALKADRQNDINAIVDSTQVNEFTQNAPSGTAVLRQADESRSTLQENPVQRDARQDMPNTSISASNPAIRANLTDTGAARNPSGLNADAQPWTSPVQRSTMEDAFHAIASAIQESVNLPKPQLLTFSGNPADYCKFVCNFDTNIEGRISDCRLRLSYLIQYCEGEAKKCIEDCVVLPPENGYARARSILLARYGKPHLVARSHVDRLVNGPSVKPNDVQGLMNLSLDMEKCEITLSQIGFVSDINNTENLRKIVKRLPVYLRSKWVVKASSLIEMGREPTFSDLLKFVHDRTVEANTMYGLDLASETKNTNHTKYVNNKFVKGGNRDRVTTLATQADNGSGEIPKRILSCVHCQGKHRLIDCEQFKQLELETKKGIVRKFKMCENCLNFKHSAKYCRKPNSCNVQGCGGKHHTTLHDSRLQVQTNESTGSCAATKFHTTERKVSLRIVPVVVQNGSTQVTTYALLDNGSDVTLCSDELIRKLDVKGISRQFTITTVNQSKERRNGVEISLTVHSLDGKETINLNRVWSVATLPISVKSLPNRKELGNWKHLADIELPQIDETDVGLLIGSDTPEVFWVEAERRGNRGEPYAIKSLLGWTVLGPKEKCEIGQDASINVQQLNFDQQIEKLWTTDFPDIAANNKVGMSQEDRQAMKMMEHSLTKEGEHYKLGLPWRDPNVRFPNNKALAEIRLRQLKGRLQRDKELHVKYRDTIEDYISKGYAKEVDDSRTDNTGKIWYLPHHPVVNPHKPGKVRVVFDCAAKYRGTSLNDQLMQGPDYMNSIVGVLLRFREGNVALVADIEAMFHQVKVSDEDCDALRFLWWPNGDLEGKPKVSCMTVHLFGATSSPSCAAYCLRRTAQDNSNEFSVDTVSTVARNLYVDDLLKSVNNVPSGIKLSGELRELLLRGGFRLTKWISNSEEVMKTIPESERAKSQVTLNIDDSSFERKLGLQWNIKEDKFVFDVHTKGKPHTRRGILSVASSLYDPLGFVAPVTLVPKLIIQNICRRGLQWDEIVSERDIQQWVEWLEDIHNLSHVSIDRCLKPAELESKHRVELHAISDASEITYGAVVYIKIYDLRGNRKLSFVMGKSRLAPIKTVSIPRLELSAAVVAARLCQLVEDESDMTIDQRFLWTDSTIVLGYIKNKTKRFKTFVANRLATIHDLTASSEWKHVPTEINPANLASRGVQPGETSKLETWLRGPKFLTDDRDNWPQEVPSATIADDDAEIKCEAAINVTTSEFNNTLYHLLSRYSDWDKLQRAVAWLLRFKAYCRRKYSKLEDKTGARQGKLMVDDYQEATKAIINMIQASKYANDIASLVKTGYVAHSSSLAKLKPLYEEAILKVGGRLQNAELPNDSKHPVILPKDHHVTDIIIRHYHETNGHAGALHILTLLRQQYWIIHGLRAVKRVIGRCVGCKRRHQRPEVQQMAPLPNERLIPDEPPFTFVGVDYFGPLYVKTGRSRSKRYGCLFTCLTTRAVHVEIDHSLDTDSFIGALLRFISRRGKPKKIFSDNGTNLTSGEKELRESITEWNQNKISRDLHQREIEWHFNPPHASHMGGIWERMIRSMRDIMKSIVKEQLLNDEALLTLAAEAEKIVNDRPITQITDDVRDPEPLSPNRILLLRPNSSLPMGVFVKSDNYCNRWWRQVQYLANVFWRRWIKEYIPALQARQKWQHPKRNIVVNDLVLMCDETLPRGKWPLGLVVGVNEGRDGLVRSCKVRFVGTIKVRPISKLCMLEQSSD